MSTTTFFNHQTTTISATPKHADSSYSTSAAGQQPHVPPGDSESRTSCPVGSYSDECDINGIPYSCYEDFYEDSGSMTDDEDLSDYEDDNVLREGDPSIYRRRSVLRQTYEFEGAGVVVERSLLAKSRTGKQRKLKFDDDATSTHEYPSERLMMLNHVTVESQNHPSSSAVVVADNDGDDDYDDGDRYHDSSSQSSHLSSYKSRSVANQYVIGQTRQSCDDAAVAPPGNRLPNDDNYEDVVQLRPVDSESVTWSNEATNDLLF